MVANINLLVKANDFHRLAFYINKVQTNNCLIHSMFLEGKIAKRKREEGGDRGSKKMSSRN